MAIYYLKGCLKCGGDLFVERDTYGLYLDCLQCGSLMDLASTDSRILGYLQKQGELNKKITLDKAIQVLGVLNRGPSTLDSIKLQPGLEGEKISEITDLLKDSGYIDALWINNDEGRGRIIITDKGCKVVDGYNKLLADFSGLTDYELVRDGNPTKFGKHIIKHPVKFEALYQFLEKYYDIKEDSFNTQKRRTEKGVGNRKSNN